MDLSGEVRVTNLGTGHAARVKVFNGPKARIQVRLLFTGGFARFCLCFCCLLGARLLCCRCRRLI